MFTRLKVELESPMSLMKQPCVYLLTSRRNGTLYVGVTSDLVQRVWQHKNDFVEGFTKRYGVHRLVWYEECTSMDAAFRVKGDQGMEAGLENSSD